MGPIRLEIAEALAARLDARRSASPRDARPSRLVAGGGAARGGARNPGGRQNRGGGDRHPNRGGLGGRGGARGTPERGKIGEPVTVTPAGDDWEVTIESGGRKFSYGRFEPRIDWTVRLSSDSVTRLFPRLDLMWYRPPKTLAFFPAEHWSVDATGTVTVPPGVYSVRTISDDAIRVWIDDSLAIDDWTPHESQVDYAALSAGTHRLRVAYQQVDGWVELRVEVVRGAARSAGSPGPH